MKRVITLALTLVLAVGGSVAIAGPAQAATGVTIKTIPSKGVAHGGKTTIKPLVKTSGKVRISSKLLTVKAGSRTVASKKSSVRLGGGTYKVTTTVKYKVKAGKKYGKVKTKKRTQSLRVTEAAPKPRTCATYAEFQSVRFDFEYPEYLGDPEAVVAAKLHNNGTVSSFSDYGDYTIFFKDYPVCGSGSISVGFFDGFAYSKTYSSY